MKSRKEKIKIVIITGDNLRHRYFANFLSTKFNVLGLISERKEISFNQSEGIIRKHFLERERKEEYYLGGNKEFRTDNVLCVQAGQVNSYKVFDWVAGLNPDFLILYGSSIIKEPFLSHFKDRIVNMHLGLSPYYRGSGTNFWPLVNKEPECVGATIHLAILKVDAGPILAQVRPCPDISDRCHDLGCKTIVAGTELMAKVLKDYDSGEITPQSQSKKGKLYKQNDFNAEAVSKMWANFDNGMMEEYLENKILRDKEYSILCIS